MSDNKKFQTIDEYISTFPKEIQAILEKMRAIVKALDEKIEETISYQMPTFKLNKKIIIHFAAFTKHIGVYPLPSGIEAFKEQLAQFQSGKGSVQFPLNKPIPYDLFRQIAVYNLNAIKSAKKSR